MFQRTVSLTIIKYPSDVEPAAVLKSRITWLVLTAVGLTHTSIVKLPSAIAPSPKATLSVDGYVRYALPLNSRDPVPTA